MEHADLRRHCERRLKALDQERQTWHAHWRELGDFILPRRGPNLLPSHRAKGARVNGKLLDSTAMLAARTLVFGPDGGAHLAGAAVVHAGSRQPRFVGGARGARLAGRRGGAHDAHHRALQPLQCAGHRLRGAGRVRHGRGAGGRGSARRRARLSALGRRILAGGVGVFQAQGRSRACRGPTAPPRFPNMDFWTHFWTGAEFWTVAVQKCPEKPLESAGRILDTDFWTAQASRNRPRRVGPSSSAPAAASPG